MQIGPGATVGGKYVLEQPLARGGMGSVWIARHAKLGSTVAIKFLDAHLATSPLLVARFEREARAAATLDTPNVAKVHDYGVEEGAPYLVMELLRGEDLSTRLRARGRLPLAEAGRILVQMSRALRRAHEAGIVHRDLKPANVFLARQEEDEEIVKVLDFGIAKEAWARADENTKTGEIFGSPHYMSPEQARAEKTVDQRADVWAVGVILYRMLTGKLPFPGEAVGEVLSHVLVDPFPPISRSAPDLPPALNGFFARALAKKRQERFSSMGEMLESFRTIVGEATGRQSLPEIHAALRTLEPGTGPVPAAGTLPATAQLPEAFSKPAATASGAPTARVAPKPVPAASVPRFSPPVASKPVPVAPSAPKSSLSAPSKPVAVGTPAPKSAPAVPSRPVAVTVSAAKSVAAAPPRPVPVVTVVSQSPPVLGVSPPPVHAVATAPKPPPPFSPPSSRVATPSSSTVLSAEAPPKSPRENVDHGALASVSLPRPVLVPTESAVPAAAMLQVPLPTTEPSRGGSPPPRRRTDSAAPTALYVRPEAPSAQAAPLPAPFETPVATDKTGPSLASATSSVLPEVPVRSRSTWLVVGLIASCVLTAVIVVGVVARPVAGSGDSPAPAEPLNTVAGTSFEAPPALTEKPAASEAVPAPVEAPTSSEAPPPAAAPVPVTAQPSSSAAAPTGTVVANPTKPAPPVKSSGAKSPVKTPTNKQKPNFGF